MRRSFWGALLVMGMTLALATTAPVFACQTTIAENATVNESWFVTCASVHRAGSYARYYTFTLNQPVYVQIDLVSSVDPYLYLLGGDQPNNSYISWDNDGGENLNARITRFLAAGTYTIEATTYRGGLTGAFRLSVRSDGGGEGCRMAIADSASVRGDWSDACTSVHRPGSYAQYYTFTLTEPASVQIDLVSAVDSYLFLLSGETASSSDITRDNDSGGNLNSRIIRSLVPGTYTIEATTNRPGLSGSFQLSIWSDGGGDACRATVESNVTRRERWTASCASVHRPGSYARYYTFTLTEPLSVQIDLVSSVDAYLFLLAGENASSGDITRDNDGGGNFNSRIVRILAAGTYTIEATTNRPGQIAAFVLSLRTDGGGPSCRTQIRPGGSAQARWNSNCTSVHRPGSYARYYSFTLTRSTKVQIDLTSSVDSYLILLSGANASSGTLTSNNDGNGRNARIVRTLAPGTYTIEATTYRPGVAGAFTLRLNQSRNAVESEEDADEIEDTATEASVSS